MVLLQLQSGLTIAPEVIGGVIAVAGGRGRRDN